MPNFIQAEFVEAVGDTARARMGEVWFACVHEIGATGLNLHWMSWFQMTAKNGSVLLQMVNCGPKLEDAPRKFAKVHEIDSCNAKYGID